MQTDETVMKFFQMWLNYKKTMSLSQVTERWLYIYLVYYITYRQMKTLTDMFSLFLWITVKGNNFFNHHHCYFYHY